MCVCRGITVATCAPVMSSNPTRGSRFNSILCSCFGTTRTALVSVLFAGDLVAKRLALINLELLGTPNLNKGFIIYYHHYYNTSFLQSVIIVDKF